MIKKIVFALAFAATALITGGFIQAKNNCKDAHNCKNNQKCQCYCSEKGDFRKKQSNDRPIFRDGRCYCKKWDYDNYPGPVERK